MCYLILTTLGLTVVHLPKVVSEAHGTTSWIDHCVCTTQAHASLVGVNIGYGMQSSDHFPLSMCTVY